MAPTLDVALAQINAINGFTTLQQNLNFEDAYNKYLRHPDKATLHTIAENCFFNKITKQKANLFRQILFSVFISIIAVLPASEVASEE